MQNSQQFEVGDRVYCMVMGQYGTVIGVDKDRYKRLTVQFEFDNVKYRFYGLDGRYTEASKEPCLFFDKPQFEVPQKPFKPAYKPGTVLCINHKGTGSYRVIEVTHSYLLGDIEMLGSKCLSSKYPEEVGTRFEYMIKDYDIQVISEPSE